MSYAYYIVKKGDEKGPITFEELIRMHLDISTRVLSPKASNWEDAYDVPELYTYFEALGIYFPAISNLASFWWRLLAYMIDAVLLYAGLIFLFNSLVLKGIINSKSPMDIFLSLVAFHAVIIVYNTICEATPMKGSIGKRICQLVVVDIDGGGLTFLNALMRNIYKVISRVIFYLGFLRVLWDVHRQAWHDEFAKTYVVKRGK